MQHIASYFRTNDRSNAVEFKVDILSAFFLELNSRSYNGQTITQFGNCYIHPISVDMPFLSHTFMAAGYSVEKHRSPKEKYLGKLFHSADFVSYRD